jgi:hypothetical protein
MKGTILSVICIITVILFNGCNVAKDKNATDQQFKVNKDVAEQRFKIEGLTFDNYPKADGSTSTVPLNGIIFCKLFDLKYVRFEGTNIIPDPADKKESRRRLVLDNFHRLVKTSQTHQSSI